MYDTYESSIDWIGNPYGGDSPGMVATTGNSTGVATMGGTLAGGSGMAARTGAGSKQQVSAKAPSGDWLQGLMIAAVLCVLITMVIRHSLKNSGGEYISTAHAAVQTSAYAVAIIPIWKLLTEALANTKLPFGAALNTYVQAS